MIPFLYIDVFIPLGWWMWLTGRKLFIHLLICHYITARTMGIHSFHSLQPVSSLGVGKYEQDYSVSLANINWDGRFNYIKKCFIPSKFAQVKWIWTWICSILFQLINSSHLNNFELHVGAKFFCWFCLHNLTGTHKQPAGCVCQI